MSGWRRRRDRLVRIVRRFASDRNRIGAIVMLGALAVVGGMLITGAVLRTQQPAPQGRHLGPETIGPGSPNFGEHEPTSGTARSGSHQQSYSATGYRAPEVAAHPASIRP